MKLTEQAFRRQVCKEKIGGGGKHLLSDILSDAIRRILDVLRRRVGISV